VLLAFGRRFKLGDDVFYLRLAELSDFENNPDKYSALAAKRKVRWKSAQKLDLPDVINSAELEQLGLPRKISAATELNGVGLSGGVVVGTARVIFNPGEAHNLGHDAVVVCPSTDPSWTALFTTIRGLVVERGGVLSHGAITARDFGIPAVACPDTTKSIPNGAKIRVDGDRGQITIIKG
jgi:rifampicin phosphotransferase